MDEKITPFENTNPQPNNPNVVVPLEGEISDEELAGVAGGANVGETRYIEGSLYLTSFAEGYSGQIKGNYKIEKALSGRPAPYLLYPWVGWVEETSVH